MKDITDRKDVETLVTKFYERVTADEVIGHFFTEVMEIDWDLHMPLMIDFWQTTLLGQVKYKGNPMIKHIVLDGLSPLKPEHFAQWLKLWSETIQANFHGECADKANRKAVQIAELMKYKIAFHRKHVGNST